MSLLVPRLDDRTRGLYIDQSETKKNKSSLEEPMQRLDGMPDIKIVTITLDEETGDLEIDYDIGSFSEGWAIYGMLNGALEIMRDHLVNGAKNEDDEDDF